jgi:hypothetical protein
MVLITVYEKGNGVKALCTASGSASVLLKSVEEYQVREDYLGHLFLINRDLEKEIVHALNRTLGKYLKKKIEELSTKHKLEYRISEFYDFKYNRKLKRAKNVGIL